MKKFKLSLFRKTFLIAILFSMMNWVNAQETPTEEKIDVSKLKAGVYKVVVTYERETFFTSIIKN